jgi:hypothetical protein
MSARRVDRIETQFEGSLQRAVEMLAFAGDATRVGLVLAADPTSGGPAFSPGVSNIEGT